ncbi:MULTISPECIES: sulfate ABC transporter substrate-binding protein [unclassified Dolichospermum]|uniref:sulfate ABC transporter substrate-binding protein n=1 Tax=unclassified Dolichospermum TaxID=2622029 RepID=UPI001580768C|nr:MULTISPECIES: sulfate ABC transporter substrate-binding protein [unclassified Dolichospermum]
MTDNSANTAKFVPITKPFFPALFLATGLSISTILPVFAGTAQKTQLISQSGKKVELTLVTYAVTKAAYSKIIPDFVAKWKRVVTLETRAGNPKNIKNWTDLTKPDVKIITANPKTSGGAKWNFLALWGSVVKNGGNDAQALKFVTDVFKNVVVLPKDARESSDAFYKKGQGDVLINYENEVILAAQQGKTDTSYIIPPVNISIEGPVAVVDKNVDKHGNREVSEAFVKFLFTPEAQREFAKVGFRPVDPTVSKEVKSKFPYIARLYTVADLGGWSGVQKKFFADGAIFDKIQRGRR